MTSFWCLFLLWTGFTNCSYVSIVDFEQVNVAILKSSNTFLIECRTSWGHYFKNTKKWVLEKVYLMNLKCAQYWSHEADICLFVSISVVQYVQGLATIIYYYYLLFILCCICHGGDRPEKTKIYGNASYGMVSVSVRFSVKIFWRSL